MKNLKQYKTPTTRDAYERGYHRGAMIASWIDLPEVGQKVCDDYGFSKVTEENQWDIVQSCAFEAENEDRQYSPFEFTASEFNKARNSEARWDAFDAGIADGIQANIDQRIKAYTR